MTLLSERPLFSIIIVSYNMAREVPRTVQSFLPPYQTAIRPEEVEVIVLENGSPRPIPDAVIERWPHNVRYVTVPNPKASPAHALNLGVSLSSGHWVCPVIDGARLVTPGLLSKTKQIIQIYDNPVIATLAYHLGSILQPLNAERGYNQEEEDKLLASINWPENAYQLFDISCLAGSSRDGWLKPLPECNAPILRREFYDAIGGYDECFDIPGGGIVNHDFFRRCVDHDESDYVMLLDEGSFHQYHGGVTTSRSVAKSDENAPEGPSVWDRYVQQYERIRSQPYAPPVKTPTLFGEAAPHVIREVKGLVEREG